MTPEQLKASILQLAIQGKLVEQRAEEGTGEELYQQIQANLDAISEVQTKKKNKILPNKILPIEEKDIPFDIPETWRWVRLGTIGYTNIGLTYRPKDQTMDGVIVLRSSNIQNGKMVYEDIVKVNMEIPDNKMCKVGDILICARNGSKRLVGKSAIVDKAGMSFGAFMAIFRSVCNQYITHVINSAYFRNSLLGDTGTTTINQITQDMLKNSLVPLPPLAEQKRIVAKIEELLSLIDRYAVAYEKLEQFNAKFPNDMKKSILEYAIQGKLVEQRAEEGTGEELYQQILKEKKRLIKEGKIKKEKPLPEIVEDEIPFDIPGSWKWVRVAQIVTLNPKNDLADDLETSFIPMPCVMDGFRNQHTFEIKLWKDIKKGFTHFAEGDVGVAKITPCFQNRKSVIFRNLKNGYGAGTTELTVVRTINDTVLPEYLLWLFKTEYFIANGVKSFTGTAGQQRIHKDYLATCLIPLPPLAEQKRIVAKLDEILPLCERLK